MHQPLRMFFGPSRVMRRLLEQCERFATMRDPVLILGEPGTGKTILAEHLHHLSGRPGRFVKESASSAPDELPTLIEAADQGTFYLDGLGGASVKVQRILRQLLEQRSIRGVGDAPARVVDVRFIAGTSADFEERVLSGFRRDVLDRFGFLKIRMPRLADRRDEILPLVDFFFQREAKAQGLTERPALSVAVRACLTAAPWTGNIRELETLCVYLSARAKPGRLIELEDLPAEFLSPLGDVLKRAHEHSRVAVRAALERSDGVVDSPAPWVMNYEMEASPELPGAGGTIREFRAAPGQGPEWLLVKFTRNGDSWIGRFRCGDGRLTRVLATPSPDHACVIAAGQGYWLSTLNPEKFELIAAYPIRDVRDLTDAGLLVFVDDTEIVAYGSQGRVWTSGRISSDGIEILQVASDSITGRVWDAPRNRAVGFLIDPRTGRLEGGLRES